jgi:hypothetical protein
MKPGQSFVRYDAMPIPPVRDSMEMIAAGPISFGVEYRFLNERVIGALGLLDRTKEYEYEVRDDKGVTIHVFVKAADGDFERLRFDCFNFDPHYHYISARHRRQDVIHLDAVMVGDPIAWALNVLRTRLPMMLARADMDDVAKVIDHAALEQAFPKVAEAAYRALAGTDTAAVDQRAISQGTHAWDTSETRVWKEQGGALR